MPPTPPTPPQPPPPPSSTPPAAPGGLTANPAGAARIDLAWTDASANETGFRIERSDAGANVFLPVGSVGANATSFSDTTVAEERRYDYRVIATSTAGDSAPSNGASATTVPAAPSGLAAAAASERSVALTWTDGSALEDGFRIERSAHGAGTFVAIGVTGVNTPRFTDGSAAGDQTYDYRVFAFNAAGDSATSNLSTAATPPRAPSGLNGAVVTPTQIRLAWLDASSTETGFRLERSLRGANAFSPAGTAPANAVALDDATVAPETRYDYRLFAVNASGDSSASSIVAVDASPAAPSTLATSIAVPGAVDLTWSDNSSYEASYRVERSVSGANVFSTVATLGANAVAFRDATVAAATTYDYRVVCLTSAGGASAPSAIATITVPSAPPSLTSISPRFGLDTGGRTITLKGRAFAVPGAGTTVVSFGRNLATDVLVVDDATITCKTPAATSADGPFVDVTVANALGTATLPLEFIYGKTLLEEDFSSGSLNPALEDPSGNFRIENGVIHDQSANNADRRYVRTRDADFLDKDFVYELTLNVGSTSPGPQILFPGIGPGEPDFSFFSEPINTVYFRIHPPDIIGGQVDVRAHPTGSFVFTGGAAPVGFLRSFGPQRIRIVKLGKRVTFSLRRDWNGTGPFVSDMSFTFNDVTVVAPFLTSTNSRLFFGGGCPNSSFDDLVVATIWQPPSPPPPPPTTDPSFATPQPYVTGTNPRFVISADLNGDGLRDLLVTNQLGNTFSILFQKPSSPGTFFPAVSYATGSGPSAAAITDVNGDGKPDVIVPNLWGGTVQVFLQDPAHAGQFLPATSYPASANPACVFVADFDHDGAPDLAVATDTTNDVWILLQDKTHPGHFLPGVSYPAGAAPQFLAPGDFNGDGWLDLATANPDSGSSSVSVLLADPVHPGAFLPPTVYVGGVTAMSIVAADLNGDGKLDLVSSSRDSNNVSVWLGRGDGTFGPRSDFATGTNAWDVQVAELNGDGKPDLIVAEWGAGSVYVLVQDPANPGSFLPGPRFSVGGNPSWLDVSDFNGDGKLDVAVANWGSGDVSVLLGNGAARTFTAIVDSHDNLYNTAWPGNPYGTPWPGHSWGGGVGTTGADDARSVALNGTPCNFATALSDISITATGLIQAYPPSYVGPNGVAGTYRGLTEFGLIGIWSSEPANIIPIGSAFNVGAAATLTVPAGSTSAYLFLAENDGAFSDNTGFFTVTLSFRAPP